MRKAAGYRLLTTGRKPQFVIRNLLWPQPVVCGLSPGRSRAC